MSHLQYYNYPGHGVTAQRELHYSQAVRIGDRIECSGQGGWTDWQKMPVNDLATEMSNAFDNVETAVKAAGGKGWSQVFRITSYHAPLTEEAFQLFVEQLKKRMPDHCPIWNCIGVEKLALDTMHVEIEVAAHDPK